MAVACSNEKFIIMTTTNWIKYFMDANIKNRLISSRASSFYIIWAQLGFLFILIVLSYLHVFKSLLTAWQESKAYSHGFLVPLISGYIIWRKRAILREIKPSTNAWGAVILFASGFMLLIGNLGGAVIVQQISLLIFIVGIVLFIAGKEYLKALTLPIAYLIFMIPLVDEYAGTIHWPFQLFAAKMGTFILTFFDVPVLLDAQYIYLPNITLEVAAECGGIRYLISILAIGVPLAYFTQRTWSRKIFLVSLALIIAILANGFRVALVSYWAYYFDQVDTHGPMHIFQGFMISQIGFVVLFAGAWILSRIPYRNTELKERSEKPVSDYAAGMQVQSIWKDVKRPWYIAILILILFLLYPYLNSPSPVHIKTNLTKFPSTLGDWKVVNYGSAAPVRGLDVDAEIVRTYRNHAGQEFTLYIGYFASQHQDKELVNYITRELHNRAKIVDVPTEQGVVRVNLGTGKSPETGDTTVFWYDINGRIVANMYMAKLATMLDSLLRARTNGAILVVFAEAANRDDVEKRFKEQLHFTSLVIPAAQSFLNAR